MRHEEPGEHRAGEKREESAQGGDVEPAGGGQPDQQAGECAGEVGRRHAGHRDEAERGTLQPHGEGRCDQGGVLSGTQRSAAGREPHPGQDEQHDELDDAEDGDLHRPPGRGPPGSSHSEAAEHHADGERSDGHRHAGQHPRIALPDGGSRDHEVARDDAREGLSHSRERQDVHRTGGRRQTCGQGDLGPARVSRQSWRAHTEHSRQSRQHRAQLCGITSRGRDERTAFPASGLDCQSSPSAGVRSAAELLDWQSSDPPHVSRLSPGGAR